MHLGFSHNLIISLFTLLTIGHLAASVRTKRTQYKQLRHGMSFRTQMIMPKPLPHQEFRKPHPT